LTNTERQTVSGSIASLLSAAAVRERAHLIFARGLKGKLKHFSVHMDRLPETGRYVAATIRQNYPDLIVPPHARWRHFVIDGVDRWQRLANDLNTSEGELARIRFDLAVTSVLLDAGAGPSWRWRDPVTNADLTRSEGLAIASLAAFEQGLFSSDPNRPMQADAAGLIAVSADRLGHVFQVRADNPLVGLEGRAALMRRLGAVMARAPGTFGMPPRVGGLYDRLADTAGERRAIKANQILTLLLKALGPVWQGRLEIDGVPLGDTWRHPAIDLQGPTHGLMPFHKLSQWLAYSLIEPLDEAGVKVTDLNGLTGLAEYRNGGLFVDMGVLVPCDPKILTMPLTPDAEAIVEWRALTVALLDEIAPLVRTELGVSLAQMPLASILEGGTWAAGRRIANEQRAGGSPPLNIVSDGSVF
jgi:hypothetical protein